MTYELKTLQSNSYAKKVFNVSLKFLIADITIWTSVLSPLLLYKQPEVTSEPLTFTNGTVIYNFSGCIIRNYCNFRTVSS